MRADSFCLNYRISIPDAYCNTVICKLMLSFQNKSAMKRHNISGSSAPELKDTDVSLFRVCFPSDHGCHSLFKKDKRIFRIRSDSQHRMFFPGFNIMFDAVTSTLFIRSEDHTYSAVQRKVQILNGFHCIDSADRRPFIISHTSSVKDSIMDLSSKWRVFPVITHRYYVQMSENRNHLIPFSHLYVTGLVIHIARTKS